jgi:hypothetical protein
MTLFETLTLLVALLGVVVSAVSLVRTRRLNEQQDRLRVKQGELTDLQLRLLRREVEEQTRRATPPADVRVSLEGSSRDAKFVMTNWGYGPAHNVDFKIKQQEGRSSPFGVGDYEEKLPNSRTRPRRPRHVYCRPDVRNRNDLRHDPDMDGCGWVEAGPRTPRSIDLTTSTSPGAPIARPNVAGTADRPRDLRCHAACDTDVVTGRRRLAEASARSARDAISCG